MSKYFLFTVAGILIAIPVIVLAVVPLYNHTNPIFLGIPFFYWFQTVWLVIAAVFYSFASLLISKVKGGDK